MRFIRLISDERQPVVRALPALALLLSLLLPFLLGGSLCFLLLFFLAFVLASFITHVLFLLNCNEWRMPPGFSNLMNYEVSCGCRQVANGQLPSEPLLNLKITCVCQRIWKWQRRKRGIDHIATAFSALILAMEISKQDMLGDVFTGGRTYCEQGQVLSRFRPSLL